MLQSQCVSWVLAAAEWSVILCKEMWYSTSQLGAMIVGSVVICLFVVFRNLSGIVRTVTDLLLFELRLTVDSTGCYESRYSIR